MKKITFVALFLISIFTLKAQNQISPIHQCDSIFDLTSKIPEILVNANPIEHSVSFYLSQASAQAGVNPIDNSTGFQATISPQIIYARVLNTTTNAISFANFQLIIHQPPFSTQLVSTICDDNDDGFATVNLTNFNTNWANYPNATFAYYESLIDAEAAVNSIANPINYQNISPNQQVIFIRVTDNNGCFSISTLSILVVNCSNENPGQPQNLTSCMGDNNQACFNLSDNNDNIINALNPANYTITYHNSQADATNDINPLNSTYCTVDTQLIFARLEKNSDQTYQIFQFNLIILSPPASANYTMQMCDGNNDGYAVFNLNQNNSPTNNTQVSYYETQADAVAGINPITYPTSYTNTTPNQQTVYIRYTINSTCFSVSSLSLIVINCNAPIVVSNNFNPSELVNILAPCGNVTNISNSSPCGIGYFTNTNGGFAYDNGVILRSGLATHTHQGLIQVKIYLQLVLSNLMQCYSKL